MLNHKSNKPVECRFQVFFSNNLTLVMSLVLCISEWIDFWVSFVNTPLNKDAATPECTLLHSKGHHLLVSTLFFLRVFSLNPASSFCMINSFVYISFNWLGIKAPLVGQKSVLCCPINLLNVYMIIFFSHVFMLSKVDLQSSRKLTKESRTKE